MNWVVFYRRSRSGKRASADAKRGETTSSQELARELSQAGVGTHSVFENAWRGGVPSRGVSVAINYVLVIGIAAIFTLGVLFFSGVFVEDQRERAIQDQLEVVGIQLGAEIEQIDRLVTTGSGEAELEVQPELIEMVAGTTYTVEVDSQAGELVLRSRSPQVEVRTAVSVSSDLTSETVRGDAVKLTYEGGVIRIERDE